MVCTLVIHATYLAVSTDNIAYMALAFWTRRTVDALVSVPLLTNLLTFVMGSLLHLLVLFVIPIPWI